MTSSAPVDYSDVQGLVRFGYAKLTEASFILLSIRDAAAARAWLSGAPVSNAVQLPDAPSTALQVAFTREGLEALRVPGDVIAGFSAEFLSGMAGEESRSRRLGDVGANSPQDWAWGAPGKVPHLLVMVYARDHLLEGFLKSIQGPHWDAAFHVIDALPTSNLYGVEPFGFTDGISQPTIDWDRRREIHGDQLDYGNLVALGEFLLGYSNEYGKYTDRPLLPANTPFSATLPAAEDVPEMRDLGRNGTYLVLRQLQQDVRGFWRFADMQTNSDPAKRQKLAESMVGRTQKGDPLVPLGNQTIAGIDQTEASQNQFTYEADPNGLRCPLGAHIRRANPRNADLPPGTSGALSRLIHTLGFGEQSYNDDVIASTRFHRLLRRGREYGPGLSVKEAIQKDAPDTGEHGIHFITCNANISRQFEFVQSSWLMSTKFGGLTEESDPMLGNREPVAGCPVTDAFSLPQQDGLRERITGLPQFVTVRGGAYFFLPGIRALHYLCSFGD
jgi:deferrochelatase/peroxidase EfeB